MNMQQAGKSVNSKRATRLMNGWTYSANFNHYQKVNNQVYVYVTPQLFGRWIVQMYKRGETGVCLLEAQIQDYHSTEKLFELGEKWLEKYGESVQNIQEDPFYPFRPDWAGRDITDKELPY